MHPKRVWSSGNGGNVWNGENGFAAARSVVEMPSVNWDHLHFPHPPFLTAIATAVPQLHGVSLRRVRKWLRKRYRNTENSNTEVQGLSPD